MASPTGRPVDIMAMYEAFTTSTVRVEARQRYVVAGDEDRARAFLDGRTLPMRPSKETWLRFIADGVADGKHFERIHVVDQPLTDYLRYELQLAYPENASAGEVIRIADRSADPGLAEVRRDYVIFDAETDRAAVVFYNYADDDTLLGLERVEDDAVIAECWRQVILARRHAASLDEFMATADR